MNEQHDVCSACYSGYEILAEVLPRLYVVKNCDLRLEQVGTPYALIFGEEPALYAKLDTLPYPDPITPERDAELDLNGADMTDEEMNASVAWLDGAAKFAKSIRTIGIGLQQIWELVELAKLYGYNPEETSLEFWLYNQMGVKLTQTILTEVEELL